MGKNNYPTLQKSRHGIIYMIHSVRGNFCHGEAEIKQFPSIVRTCLSTLRAWSRWCKRERRSRRRRTLRVASAKFARRLLIKRVLHRGPRPESLLSDIVVALLWVLARMLGSALDLLDKLMKTSGKSVIHSPSMFMISAIANYDSRDKQYIATKG